LRGRGRFNQNSSCSNRRMGAARGMPEGAGSDCARSPQSATHLGSSPEYRCSRSRRGCAPRCSMPPFATTPARGVARTRSPPPQRSPASWQAGAGRPLRHRWRCGSDRQNDRLAPQRPIARARCDKLEALIVDILPFCDLAASTNVVDLAVDIRVFFIETLLRYRRGRVNIGRARLAVAYRRRPGSGRSFESSL